MNKAVREAIAQEREFDFVDTTSADFARLRLAAYKLGKEISKQLKEYWGEYV